MTLAFRAFIIAEFDATIYHCVKTYVCAETPMESSTRAAAYDDWCPAVDERLRAIYCIAIEEAGFDEEYLDRHWKSNETPAEFVEWFGNKNDLDRRPSPIRTMGR